MLWTQMKLWSCEESLPHRDARSMRIDLLRRLISWSLSPATCTHWLNSFMLKLQEDDDDKAKEVSVLEAEEGRGYSLPEREGRPGFCREPHCSVQVILPFQNHSRWGSKTNVKIAL